MALRLFRNLTPVYNNTEPPHGNENKVDHVDALLYWGGLTMIFDI